MHFAQKFKKTSWLLVDYPSPTRVSQDRSKFQTKNMESNLSPDELPEGFSSVDPTGAGGSQDAAQAQKLAKEEQRRAILEQALTPEALARLGTIKVCAVAFEYYVMIEINILTYHISC
jgi:hypothetical protein